MPSGIYIRTEKAKKNMSLAKDGKYIGKNNPMYGKHHSKETKKKQALARKGTSGYWNGKHFSDMHRRKLRIKMLEYIKSIRGKVEVNVGKNETVLLNNEQTRIGKSILRQYHIRELGYVVDGYEPITNTVYEIYEKHHSWTRKMKQDAIREREIRNTLGCKFVIIWDII